MSLARLPLACRPRPIRPPSAAEQQLSPELRARRDQLELQLSGLRDRKAKMNEEKFYQELEKILLEIARLYEGT